MPCGGKKRPLQGTFFVTGPGVHLLIKASWSKIGQERMQSIFRFRVLYTAYEEKEMGEVFGKVFDKIIVVVIVVAVILGIREAVLTDDTVSSAFMGLLSYLPFSKTIVEGICKVLKYQSGIASSLPAVTVFSVAA